MSNLEILLLVAAFAPTVITIIVCIVLYKTITSKINETSESVSNLISDISTIDIKGITSSIEETIETISKVYPQLTSILEYIDSLKSQVSSEQLTKILALIDSIVSLYSINTTALNSTISLKNQSVMDSSEDDVPQGETSIETDFENTSKDDVNEEVTDTNTDTDTSNNESVESTDSQIKDSEVNSKSTEGTDVQETKESTN